MGREAKPRLYVARFVAALAVVIALAPLWLGAALAPLNLALGAHEHVCACGMKAGTCGCPDCERLEEERKRDAENGSAPIVRGGCHDDEIFSTASLPPAVIPPAFAIAPIAGSHDAARTDLPTTQSRDRARPPTPPPRLTA